LTENLIIPTLQVVMKTPFLVFLAIVFSTLAGCDEELRLPQVVSGQIESVTNTTAIAHGEIVDTGGASIVVHGICWDSTPNPTIDLMTKTTSSNAEGKFQHQLTGLVKNKTYYFRAFAQNSSGTSYGDVVTFNSFNSPEPSGNILALPSDVLLENGVEIELIRQPGYFGESRIIWAPINNANLWKVSFSGVKPGSTRLFAHIAGIEIYFPGSTPPPNSKVYQLKPDNTVLNANEASLKYYSGDVTNDPTSNAFWYQGWSATGALKVEVIRGEVNISFSNVTIDSNIAVSGNLKLR
jgi:hypothetical protein